MLNPADLPADLKVRAKGERTCVGTPEGGKGLNRRGAVRALPDQGESPYGAISEMKSSYLPPALLGSSSR